MSSIPEIQVRDELLTRRARLEAVRTAGAAFSVTNLIAEVDAALDRLTAGTYGLCQTCHDPIEAERLIADPLTTFCLDHLTQQERLHLERDMELARDIQRALLPPAEIVLRGWDGHFVYEPAGAVSGDYCDVITGTAPQPSIIVGDVSGKGVSASILMSNLHALFRSLSGAGVAFEDVVSRVNHIFCQSTLPSSFATLVYARLQENGELTLCNAGHCPPLLVSNGRVEALAPTGPAVGLVCDGQFGTVVRRIAAGDLLVVYTDGLTETFNAQDEEYGIERLATVVSGVSHAEPRDVARACLQDLRAFSPTAPRRDDLTLMVLRRSASGRATTGIPPS
jgi:sigma-B regulation protein RsbU (phosphoserine phosphatase)